MSFLEVQQHVLRLKDQLVAHLGGDLRSVVLFGSAVTGDFLPDVSDINLILTVCGAEKFPSLSPALRKSMNRMLRTPPVVWVEERFPDLPRIFPVEMREIVQFHRCLHGEDPLVADLVKADDLKSAVHRGMHRLHIELQRDLILDEPGRTPFDTVYDFIFLVRGFLRTQGLQPARTKRDSLEQFAERFDTALTTAKILLGVRARTLGPPGEHERKQMYDYYVKDVEKVIQVMNKLWP